MLIRIQTGRPRDLVLFPAEVRDFSVLLSVQTGCGDHTAFNSIGTAVSFRRVKRPGREPDQSDQFMPI
jgi:hypothetical protein